METISPQHALYLLRFSLRMLEEGKAESEGERRESGGESKAPKEGGITEKMGAHKAHEHDDAGKTSQADEEVQDQLQSLRER